MYVSAREKIILDILLSRKEGMTIKELASEIEVSVRTIHRDLKRVEDVLEQYELKLVKKAGIGIQLAGDQEKISKLQQSIDQSASSEYTPDERQTLILCMLLEAAEPLKLLVFAHDLRVTIATISSDLTKIEQQLQSFQLTLIRRRGYGVEISGSETAKRRMMSVIIAENLNETAFLSLVKENIQKKSVRHQDSISERLLRLIDKDTLLAVEETMEEIQQELPYSIADSAYIGLIVHLALAIERIKQGENIQMSAAYLEKLQNSPEYPVAKKIINQLMTIFKMDIPKAEVGYITMHLQGAKIRQDHEYLLEKSSLQTAIKAKNLIHYVEVELDVDLADNDSLFHGLVAHLKPALYRIQQQMGITNPLLLNIQKEYADLFQIVKAGVKKVFPELPVPDEEVGYLVMHFGAALLGEVKTNNLKAYIICSSGIGTSKMLATRLRRELPEIKEVTNISLFELNEISINKEDLVISTIQLPDFSGTYIVVSPILTDDEIERIRQYIKKQPLIKSTVRRKEKVDLPAASAERVTKRLNGLHLYAEAAAEMLASFKLSSLEKGHSIKSALDFACRELVKKDMLHNADTVFAALLEREQLGGLGIPGTNLALFHTRHADVKEPSFTLLALGDPLKIRAMDETEIKVDVLLLLLSPEPYHAHGLEILSLISASIIENNESIQLFESKQAEPIQSYLAATFEQFIEEKIKESRSV
ncbi:PRD domain-containing protein [Bacillus aerolatus]|uniref:PRD domain-containing protein n=1 Tax=Bacillus aerolatus TaxID=2653354 RepID=A0A6I1FDJ5_9BACI|nr:BglG family transcription antiterminator [Bacillus aerolatus]KAB7705652.1 PRD domain-containing protein [Bacillus aerolatus]